MARILRAAVVFAACSMATPVPYAPDSGPPTQGGIIGEGPGGLRIDRLKAPRVSMATLNAVNRLMEPLPAPWPSAFSVAFQTNMSKPIEQQGSGGETGEGVLERAVDGMLYYEEGRGQLITHSAGSVECEKFYSVLGSCSLVFNKEGMYAKVEPPTEMCCLDIPGLHAPPPNWTTAAPHKFIGTRLVRGRMCHGFSYTGAGMAEDSIAHEYWQDSKTRLPCAFSFVIDPRMTWFFNLSTFAEGPQDPSLFTVPDHCSKACARDTQTAASLHTHSAALPASWGGNREFHSTVDEVVDIFKALQQGTEGSGEGGVLDSDGGM